MGNPCSRPDGHTNTCYLYLDSGKTTKSTKLYGPKPAMEYLYLQRKYLMPIIRRYGGSVDEICWDSFLAGFSDPINAIYAAVEIRDVYHNNTEFKANFLTSKISLSGLCISYDKEICEEVGENHVEDGLIVIHGSDLLELIKPTISFYGFEVEKWVSAVPNNQYKDHEFMSIKRVALEEGIETLNNNFVLFISPNALNKDPEHVKLLEGESGKRFAEIAELLWFFEDKTKALQAAEKVFKHNNGQCKVALGLAEQTLVHKKLKIISSYGINANCKLAEDLDHATNSIRVTKNVFAQIPGPDYVPKEGSISGDPIAYWDLSKI